MGPELEAWLFGKADKLHEDPKGCLPRRTVRAGLADLAHGKRILPDFPETYNEYVHNWRFVNDNLSGMMTFEEYHEQWQAECDRRFRKSWPWG